MIGSRKGGRTEFRGTSLGSFYDDECEFIPSVEFDATGRKNIPLTVAQWHVLSQHYALPTLTPSSIWGFQESDNAIIDLVGNVDLTKVGLLHNYRQTTSTWSRFYVSTDDAGIAQSWTNTTTAINLSLTDTLTVAYVVFPSSPPGGVRDILVASTAAEIKLNVDGKLRVEFGATGNLSVDNSSKIIPIILQVNNTDLVSAVYTPHEKFIGTYVLPPSVNLMSFGGNILVASGCGYLYGCQFTGINARLTQHQISLLIKAMGWNVEWEIE